MAANEVAIFDYIYGVLHCPAYREFLKIDFPRVPYPPSPEVFRDVQAEGTEIRRLHLMKDPAVGETPCPFIGEGDSIVAKVAYENCAVFINDAQCFENVPEIARLTPLRREEMALAALAGRLTKAQAARIYGVISKIVSRWVEHHKTGCRAAMMDRSFRLKAIPRQIAQALTERVIALHCKRLTGKHIAMQAGVSPATVSRVLKRAGLSRIKDIEPAEPVVRYEYSKPGG